MMTYITFLCARQTRNRVARAYPDFFKTHRKDAMTVDRLLKQIPVVRDRLSPHMTDSVEFLDWYEKMFLRMIKQPDTGEDE